jgi:hypothetical protein
MKSLQSLIQDSYARAGVKVASAADAVQAPPTIDDDFLTGALGLEGKPETTAPAGGEPKVASRTEKEAIANLDYSEKIATALEYAADIITKTASSPMDAPGPAVAQPPRAKETSTAPTATTTAHKDMDGGSKPEHTQGNPNGIQTDKAIHGDPDWTKNKEAAVLFAQAKLASAEQFVDSHPEIAEALLNEALEVSKLAGFEIAPAKGLPAHSDDAKVKQDSGHTSVMPDNAGAIRITKAEARDSTTREAKERMSETPKKDNAVAANAATTTGLKLSSDQLLDKLAAARESGTEKKAVLGVIGGGALGASRAHEGGSNVGVGAVRGAAGGYAGSLLGSFGGAALGSLAGDAIGAGLGNAALGNLVGSSIGTAAGHLGGAAAGAHLATKGLKKKKDESGEKKASSDDLMKTASFLQQVEQMASAPDATAEDKEKAASLLEYAKEHGLAATHELLEEA